MQMRDHLEKLGYFQKLCRFRSINEGSRSLGISQAGLSKSIAKLELLLDTKLFFRSNDGFSLTKEGELVLSFSDQIFKKSDELESRLRSLKLASIPEKLYIGMYDSIAAYLFSSLNNYVKNIYPSVSINLIVNSSTDIFGLISRGLLDLAIGVGFEKSKETSCEYFPLFQDHYSSYISTNNQENIEAFPLIIFPAAKDEDGVAIEVHLAKTISKRGAHRVTNFETLKALALQGAGIGILPTQVAKPLLLQGQLSSVTIPRVKQQFGRHQVGMLASNRILKEHREFVEDVYRLGQRWANA